MEVMVAHSYIPTYGYQIAIQIKLDNEMEANDADDILHNLEERFEEYGAYTVITGNVKILNIDYNEQAIMDILFSLIFAYKLPVNIRGERILMNSFDSKMYDRILMLLREHYKMGQLSFEKQKSQMLEQQAFEEMKCFNRK